MSCQAADKARRKNAGDPKPRWKRGRSISGDDEKRKGKDAEQDAKHEIAHALARTKEARAMQN